MADIRATFGVGVFGLLAGLFLLATACRGASGGRAAGSDERSSLTERRSDFAAGSDVDVFTFAVAEAPETLTTSGSGRPLARVVMNLYEGLLMPAPTTDGAEEPGDLVRPGVAEDWEVSGDGETYTFHLRDEATWSNGDSVTAGDFEYAWRRALRPRKTADYHQLLFVIEGAESYVKSGGGGDWESVGVEAPDPETLVVELEHPAPYFPELVAYYPMFPQPREAIENHGNDWTSPDHIVTNGAYELVSRERGERIVLAKRDGYWDAGEVSIERAEIRVIEERDEVVAAYLDEELHWTGRPLALSTVPNLRGREDLHIEPMLGTYYVQVNVSGESFRADPRFTRALNLAIDRKAIVREAFNGVYTPAETLVPDAVPGYEFEWGIERDVERALELLAELREEHGGELGAVELLHNDRPVHRRVCTALKRQLRETLDLEVELESTSWRRYLNTIMHASASWEMARAGWIGDYSDPMTFLKRWSSKGGGNHVGWEHQSFDSKIRAAQSASRSDRRRHLRGAERVLLEEGPVVPLAHYAQATLVGTRVRGFEPHLRDIHLMKDLSVEQVESGR